MRKRKTYEYKSGIDDEQRANVCTGRNCTKTIKHKLDKKNWTLLS